MLTAVTVCILILSLNVIVSLQVPLPNSRIRTKYTCLPRNGKKFGFNFSKKEWDNSCSENGENPLRYTAAQMQSHIEHSIGLPHFQLPNDKTRCFAVDTYDTSASLSACPAYCKLRDNIDRLFCDDKTVADLKVNPPQGNAVLIRSPNYNCINQTYQRAFMCVYSVKMTCNTNRLFVSHSDIDISENDYIQVFDNSRSLAAYRPIRGNSWPADQLHYPSSNLKVVFWSDRDYTQGNGFNLQFSCSTTEESLNEQYESGNDSDIIRV